VGKTKKRRESIEIIHQMFKTIHQYYVYILASKKNGTLYIGMTNDLETRVLQHKQKINEGFTSKYNVINLVYFENHQYVNDAIKREKQLKKWNRQWKINLIEEENKDWKDLSENWNN
jgi:putative endonuclease